MTFTLGSKKNLVAEDVQPNQRHSTCAWLIECMCDCACSSQILSTDEQMIIQTFPDMPSPA